MRRLVLALLLLAVAPHPAAAQEDTVAGRFLVAAPTMSDRRFSESVILMLNHDAEGAFGLIVNKALGEGPLEALLKGFKLDPAEGAAGGRIRFHYGGPVDRGSMFVLHSTDYKGPKTRVMDGIAAMTMEMDVLEAVARGEGPEKLLLVLGYSGWGPGQLEREMARGDWLVAPADPKLLFDGDLESKWRRVSDGVGVPL